jgi:hypothetical protein
MMGIAGTVLGWSDNNQAATYPQGANGIAMVSHMMSSCDLFGVASVSGLKNNDGRATLSNESGRQLKVVPARFRQSIKAVGMRSDEAIASNCDAQLENLILKFNFDRDLMHSCDGGGLMIGILNSTGGLFLGAG